MMFPPGSSEPIQCDFMFVIFSCLQLGATVEIKHPETGDIVEGVISKLTDSSMYTVGKSPLLSNDMSEKKCEWT